MEKYQGLTNKEVLKNIEKFGLNEIPSKKEFRLLKIFLSQFKSFLILILIFAAILSLILGEHIDAIAIFTIILINSSIGFFQEYKADNAVKSLKKLVIQKILVIRDNKQQEIDVKELVPEDIVILSEGDKVPADLKILESYALKIDESILTGESHTISKKKDDQAFKGTLITSGRAITKVINTGINTEFGKIIKLISKEEKSRSPLTIQLDQLSKKVGLTVLILIIILFILGILRDFDIFEMLFTSVALGVSAIPEGMPIIVTLTLAMGVQILSKQKAIVRKMNAIETLGATTVICSDKTGTITLNEMTVSHINSNLEDIKIPGIGYKIKEKIKLKTNIETKLLEIGENCNNSFVDKDNILGDPTEIALKILNRKFNYAKEFKRLDEIPFSSERKMMSTLHKIGNKKEIFSKGAIEEILKKSKYILVDKKIKKLDQKMKKDILHTAEKYSTQALRVLGFAYKEYTNKLDESELIYVGMTAMMDPPRKTVKSALKIAQNAGIKIKIITGDHPITAKAIAEKIGLSSNEIYTGEQIKKLSDKKLRKVIENCAIFARTRPEDKYRIIDLLQKNGEVVAATGDGVNDAPALKHADVGVAMGIKGTEATKEVADIVLKNDDFSTIVNTIKEGRRIYHNILSFIKYMLSANFDTIMTVGILTILGYPLPILPLQILWINIATDSLPALALGKSNADKDIMKEKPHPKKEKIFKKFSIFILSAVSLQIIANTALYFYGLHQDKLNNILSADLSTASHARTLVFTEIVMFELFLAFVCKEEKLNLKSIKSNKSLIIAVLISFILQLIMIYAPFMQKTFKTTALNLNEWLMVIAFAMTALLVPLLTKIFRKLKN